MTLSPRIMVLQDMYPKNVRILSSRKKVLHDIVSKNNGAAGYVF